MKSPIRLAAVVLALIGLTLPVPVNAECAGAMTICGTGDHWCDCYSGFLSYVDGNGNCHYGPFEQISSC